MATIIAIGGGSVGFKDKQAETTPIDQEIIRASGKTNPQLLFIPTASSDNHEYVEAMRGQFGHRLGCSFDSLLVHKNTPSRQEIERKVAEADIIYVGGGNTLMMMKRWRSLGMDTLLHNAATSNKVLCGLSAGSICWFKCGNSDSRKYKNPDADLIKVTGLGLINALHCPHYDTEAERKASLKAMMQKTPGIAIALDNCAALQVTDNHYRIIRAKPTAQAYKVYWKRDTFYEEPLSTTNDFTPLSNLLRK